MIGLSGSAYIMIIHFIRFFNQKTMNFPGEPEPHPRENGGILSTKGEVGKKECADNLDFLGQFVL